MKKFILVLVVFGLALGFSTQVSAIPLGPDGFPPGQALKVEVDGKTKTVPFGQIKNDKGGVVGFKLIEPVTLEFGSGEDKDSVTIDFAGAEFDPVINLAIGVTDAAAASTFGFSIVSPISLPVGTTSVNYTIDLFGTFTDGAGDGGSIAVAGFQSFGVMDVSLNGSAIDGVGGGVAFPTPGSFYGAFNKAGSSGAGPFTSFDIALGFTGSGSNDSYTLNGRFEVLPVPEPATMLLIGTGLLGLAGFTRRFKKN
jgi:hypothetical protein